MLLDAMATATASSAGRVMKGKKADEQTAAGKSSSTASGITHVFSSSYLGRLFKNPFSLSNVASFKMRSSTRSRTDRYVMPDRPITGRACSNCFDPSVLEKWDNQDGNADDDDDDDTRNHRPDQIRKSSCSTSQRVCDVLELPTAAYNASFNFIKRVSDVLYCLRLGDSKHEYPCVDADVLASERVKEGIAQNVARCVDEEEEQKLQGLLPKSDRMRKSPPTTNHKKRHGRAELLAAGERTRARSTLSRMRANISMWVQKVAAYILLKLLRIILRTVQVCPSQIEQLNEAARAGKPVIYLPNHRSHLDYVLLSFTLAHFRIRTPYVAAGDNLCIPFFSWLMRSLGAFFIKRRTDRNDHVYRAILRSYIEELLRKGESLEFFVEAGRSRTGRLILPKAGLLSVVVEAQLQGIIDDAYVVPVSVSYEKLIEGSFSSELMGEPKKKETFWTAVKAIWNVFSTKYGSVRIDFGQPVTINDYLSSLRSHLSPLPNSEASIEVYRQQQHRGSLKSLSSRNSLLSLCSGIDLNQMTDDNHRLIKALSHHIAYDFTQNSALMCTQMLAFLLTTKFRHGGRLDDIVDDFHWLCQRVLANGRDVGFSGHPRDVVRYAIELLGPELVTAEISDIDSGVVSDSGFGGPAGVNGIRYENDGGSESHLWIVRPAGATSALQDLSYYAAPVSLVFLQEAVIANALLAASQEAGKAIRQQSCDSFEPPPSAKSDCTIHSSKIIERALAMTDLLQYEFLFARPCVPLRQCLERTLERMVQEGLLVRRSSSSTATTASSTGSGSTWSVRFCLDRNQILDAPTYSSASSRRSSVSTFCPLEDEAVHATTEKGSSGNSNNISSNSRKAAAAANATAEGAFYMASEDDEEMADYEDEVEEEEDDIFSRPSFPAAPTTTLTSIHRRCSYGVASLVDTEDDYNSDVVRLYGSVLAPLLETYKFAFKTVLAELARPAPWDTLKRTQWKTEAELLQGLLTTAKHMVREKSCSYVEFINIEPMRNAIKWLVSKGVLLSANGRLRLHDSYIDDRETLDRFCAEIDDLCVVVTY